jgi:hypothetical protein
MTEEFDKEINALLRQTATGETAFSAADLKSKIKDPKSVHLDADEISAFAENALPEKMRLRYTTHFADCDRCRKILSNTILLNSEAETVSVSSPVISLEIADLASVPWYRRLFAFPNVAYAMGALVVLFGGFLAFTVLQNVNSPQNTEVSQISETQPRSSGPSAESEPDFFAANADTMSNMSVTSANSTSNVMMSNSASVASNTSTATSVINNSAGQMSTANTASVDTNSTQNEAQLNEAKREIAKNSAENKNTMQLDGASADGVAANLSVTGRQVTELPLNNRRIETLQAAPPTATLASPAEKDDAISRGKSSAKMRKADAISATNKQIGGKTFNRRENVWYDSAYNGQNTTNVSRGSNEYKKLDSDLRSIADNLSGTAVIVWKSKAYRIQ